MVLEPILQVKFSFIVREDLSKLEINIEQLWLKRKKQKIVNTHRSTCVSGKMDEKTACLEKIRAVLSIAT